MPEEDLIVRPATAADAAAWDAFVARFPHHSPLARYLWRDMLERHHGATTRFLIAETPAGTIAGVVAAYVVRSLRGRRRLYSLQRGFLTASDAATRALTATMADWVRREGVHGGALTGETQGAPDIFARGETTTLVVPLLADDAMNWAGLRDKTRNMVRKAERSGITVARGIEHLPALYDIYAREMVARGIPIYSRALWQDVARAFGDRAEILVAQHEGRVVAGLFLLFGEATACDFFQASQLEARKLAPVPLLLWQAMREATALGLSRFDLGPSTPGSNTFQAKVNFGGVPETFARYGLDGRPEPGLTGAAAPAPPAARLSFAARTDRYLAQRAWWPIRYRYHLWKRRQGAMF